MGARICGSVAPARSRFLPRRVRACVATERGEQPKEIGERRDGLRRRVIEVEVYQVPALWAKLDPDV